MSLTQNLPRAIFRGSQIVNGHFPQCAEEFANAKRQTTSLDTTITFRNEENATHMWEHQTTLTNFELPGKHQQEFKGLIELFYN
jgi:hypothetical protein